MAEASVVISLEILYVTGTAAAKFSILLLYRRLFGLYRKFLVALYVIAAITFCYSLVEILVIIFACRPINAAWDFSVKGTCVDLALGGIIVGSVNVATDFVTLFLPMPMVWGLKIELKWKIQLVGIFLLGGFVCIGSIYRVTVLNGLSSPDATWALTPAAIWAFVENAIGIVSACLPTLRPVYNLLVHGHHCSVRDKCSRCCQTAYSSEPQQKKVCEYTITSSGEQTVEGMKAPRIPWINGRMVEPQTPPTTYTTPTQTFTSPSTTYTTPAGSGAAEPDSAAMTFWVSDSTEPSPPLGRETPSIEIW
ncbi:MAG: hypothetical protein Q9195_003539 [Heterodermia aff. obscurata]